MINNEVEEMDKGTKTPDERLLCNKILSPLSLNPLPH
jgi:hypothetical protein